MGLSFLLAVFLSQPRDSSKKKGGGDKSSCTLIRHSAFLPWLKRT